MENSNCIFINAIHFFFYPFKKKKKKQLKQLKMLLDGSHNGAANELLTEF